MCVHLPWDRGTFGPNFIWFKMKVTHLYLFIRKLMKKGNEHIRKSSSKRVQFHPKLFQLLSMRWIWMKLSFFNVTLSNVFIRLFFIRFLVSKCKTVMFVLNQMELGQIVHSLMLTVHTFLPLSYLVHQWDVLNSLQNQVTTKPISSRFPLQRPISNHTRASFLYITIQSLYIYIIDII